MNKLGLSLAADSAITSGRDGARKVYNTANKLFALSPHHPIGVMVFGSASFMEIPWEVILKSYRSVLKEEKFDDVHAYFNDFTSFLNRDERFKAEDNEEIIVHRAFSDMLKELVIEVEDRIEEESSKEEITDQQVTEWLEAKINSVTAKYEKMEDTFIEMDYTSFVEKFGHVVKEITEELVVYELPEHLKNKLYQLCFVILQKDFFSMGSSGIVMAGYGEKEIFPHLVEYRLEGFLFGQLKYKKLREKKISYTNDKHDGTASIVPFAQQEMVHSFMNGIEPVLEDTYYEIIKKVALDYHNQIEAHVGVEFTEQQVKKLEEMGKELYESIANSVKEYQYNYYIKPLMGIVRSLPKEELADMAEALVNLTSFKRRVTRDTESVGGPVDVAVITKGDGFVWVKKKNYFDPDLNPHYFNKLLRGDKE